jgi:hypothetical protein
MTDTTKDSQARRDATVSLVAVTPRKKRGATADTTQVPEWTTARWRHRVEAEARNRLKHDLHDVGGARHR